MYIPLKKQVRGGVLLYALLMLAIFSLVLQFYLNRQISANQLLHTSRDQAKAYLMAQLTLEEAKQVAKSQTKKEAENKEVLSRKTISDRDLESTEKENIESSKDVSKPPMMGKQLQGHLSFTEGQASYLVIHKLIEVTVSLDTGTSYHYKFPYPMLQEGGG